MAASYRDKYERWWTGDGDDRHERLISETERIKASSGYESRAVLASQFAVQMYGRDVQQDGDEKQSEEFYVNLLSKSTRFNAVRSARNTVLSKVTKVKPRIQFLTSGGNQVKQNKAKNLTKFIDGLWRSIGHHQLAKIAAADAGTYGNGYIHAYGCRMTGTIKHEVVPFRQVYCNPAEALHRRPRSLYRDNEVHRDVLAAQYPEHAEDIYDAPAANYDDSMICVTEAWHLASGPETGDGRHVIAIKGATLLDEEWTRERFPIVPYRWDDTVPGWWSQGVPERNWGAQCEMNAIALKVHLGLKLCSVPHVLYRSDSGFTIESLDNMPGTEVTYDAANPPRIWAENAIPPENFRELERLKEEIYESEGINAMAAGSNKPAGLNSGRALEEFADAESERLVDHGQQWEDFHLEIARVDLDIARELYSDHKLTVKAPGTDFIEEIDFSSIDLDEDQYIIGPYPTTSLPTRPAMRLKTVTEMIQGQLISVEAGRRLLEFPDIEQEIDLEDAGLQDARRHVAEIIETGKYEPPDPYQDLDELAKQAQKHYLAGKKKGMDESVRDMLRTLMKEVDALKSVAAPPQPAPAPAPEQAAAAPDGMPPPNAMA